MKKIFKKIGAVCIALLIAASFAPEASAADFIDLTKPADLAMHYLDNGKAISGAGFKVYRIAELDEYGYLTVNKAFKRYIREDINGFGQDEWADLASTLKGYTARDKLKETASGTTDTKGDIALRLEPGLYLVVGSPLYTSDYYTYTPTPFIVHLPGKEEGLNMWDYSVDVNIKYEKEHNPPDKKLTRTVIKLWDDEGYESIRPDSVKVQLLCNGDVKDTVTLSKKNNWSHTWDSLSPDCEWYVAEKETDMYEASVSREDDTFTVTNRFAPPSEGVDPPVMKRITGDRPENTETFTFTIKAEGESCPMPEGSSGMTKDISIRGAGWDEFGRINFTEPGEYVYTVSEKPGKAEGYTYDKTVYTVKYTVEQRNGELKVRRYITTEKGKPAYAVEFTNSYKHGGKLPQTGQLWWPVMVFFVTGCAMVIIGMLIRNSRKN